MDMQIPLNKLRFGHEAGEGINARVTGRDDGIAALAANIHANGQIENLIVKEIDGGLYAVANGNRRLAAFQMIYGAEADQPIGCTLHDVDNEKAFEFSLATAITAQQLHPVDQHEAFAKMKERGQTEPEIALHYGMTERQVEQALALGHLSPKVRDAWRKGEIKASTAKAFTLAADQKAQDELLEELRSDAVRFGKEVSEFDDDDIKERLKIDAEIGALVEFVGIDAYVSQGGKVTRDLFGTDHQVSDVKLVQKMAEQQLASECKKLQAAGWGFAVTLQSVRNTRHSYSTLKADFAPTPEEKARLEALDAIFNAPSNEFVSFHELSAAEQGAALEYRMLYREIQLRGYTPKMMEKAGCFVSVNGDGQLEVEYGRVKPAQKEQAAKVEKEERKEQKKTAAKQAKAEGKPAPESTTLSNALVQRLEAQLTAATRDAIAGDPLLAESPFAEILAKVVCSQIVPDSIYRTPDAIRTKLPSIRQVLNAEVFNAAIAKRFDAKDYFESAPKGFALKAIIEAVNEDEARKIAKQPRPEIAKFALGNVMKTGWLPKELRTVHYKGPGSEGYKRPAADVGRPVPPHGSGCVSVGAPAKPTTTEKVKKAKVDRETKRNAVVMKRAAKKVAKKTAKKRR